jgi:hypothetical protein
MIDRLDDHAEVLTLAGNSHAPANVAPATRPAGEPRPQLGGNTAEVLVLRRSLGAKVPEALTGLRVPGVFQHPRYHASMSYDLAAWEGARPAADRLAERLFSQLYDQYINTDAAQPPTAKIIRYVATLTEKCPDLSIDNLDTCPWSCSSLINNASGTILYFGMNYEMADDVATYAAETARRLSLVCYDPQTRKLR